MPRQTSSNNFLAASPYLDILVALGVPNGKKANLLALSRSHTLQQWGTSPHTSSQHVHHQKTWHFTTKQAVSQMNNNTQLIASSPHSTTTTRRTTLFCSSDSTGTVRQRRLSTTDWSPQEVNRKKTQHMAKLHCKGDPHEIPINTCSHVLSNSI